jgi:hypothetical protein
VYYYDPMIKGTSQVPRTGEKAVLAPVRFPAGASDEFDRQVEALRQLLDGYADILPPTMLGDQLPEADAALFPELIGEAYRQLDAFQKLERPVLILTSEFGTMSMWDWEIAAYLKASGVAVLAPYTLDQAQAICRTMGVRRALRKTKFLVFQDNPGAGFQASIFKRFYWWEDECTQRMLDKFGVSIEKKSFKGLGEEAATIPEEDVDAAIAAHPLPVNGLGARPVRSAMRVYLALKRQLDADGAIGAMGINCLNESHFSDSTPCLAWDLLYSERGLIWGCEADTVSMLTKLVLHRSLGVPIMMTNLYPFLMGQAALKHEKISHFPDVPEPENCLLVAHCGYLGVVPRAFATEWTLKEKVLGIVNDNATAIDARLPEGDITLAKLSSQMDRLILVEGRLESYVQYPGSDCRNGGLLRVGDGHKLMRELPSHHALLMTGHHKAALLSLAEVFGLEVSWI